MGIQSLIQILALCALVSGCAGVKMSMPDPDRNTHSQLVELFQSPVDNPRHTPPDGRLEVVNRIDKRILPATISVCQRTFSNPQDCPGLLRQRTLTVYAEHEGINAFVDGSLNLSVLGGMVREVGNDDELAFVLAHEYSHSLMGHIQKTMRNQMLGQLAGGLAGLGVAAAAGVDLSSASAGQVIDGGVNIGGTLGSLRFSKGMELEADHLAMFILNESGYDMDKAIQYCQRQGQIQYQHNWDGSQQVLGFFETHPSDEERLMRLAVTRELIRQGMDRPRWKK